MKLSYNITMLASGAVIPTALAFLQESLIMMVPWFITMFTIVVADLAAGLFKSYKLGVKIHVSRAARETMGKLIVYFAFVCMICCVNVAAKNDFDYAKWAALLIVVFEFGSIVSNILKPHGIDISLNAIIKAFLRHSWLPLTCEEVDEIVKDDKVKHIVEEEQNKWNKPQASK